MNEIDPLSEIQSISMNSDVVGNGATIKNFRGKYISINGNRTIDQLHLENFFFTSNKPISTSNNNSIAYITRSKISC